MVAVVQKKAFPPGRYKGQLFDAARLRQFAEGTNRALQIGVPVPALKKHAKVAADDKETEQFSATDGAGWLKKLEQEEDGSLTPHFDVPEEIAKGVADGTIKFTSPEFRDTYESADGRYKGPITRHWAFTPLPKAHDQGALAIAMSEGVFQFGEDDYEGPPKDGDGDGEAGEGKSDAPQATDPSKPKNPDMPPKATDSSKLAAFVAGMAQLGVVLPSDFDLADESAIDLLITGINTQCKAKADAEADKAKNKPEEPESKDSEQGIPFSEDEISALPSALQIKARKANADAEAAAAKALQFSEERKASAKEKAVAAVRGSKLFPALKTKLLGLLDVAQFSEEGEAPTLTVESVAALVAESLPPEMQFAEGDGSEVTHPDGEAFFKPKGGAETPEEAEAIVNEMFTRNKAG